MEPIRVSAKTLQDAITKACVELGLTSEAIEYEILEHGSNGVFGIGARPYVIRAAKKEEKTVSNETFEKKEKAPQKESLKEEKKEADLDVKADPKAEQKDAAEKDLKEGAEASIQKAEEFLSSVFEKIGVDVKISTSYDAEEREIGIDLSGEDMGMLIGKRGQTLDALQYLTGQVVNKHLSEYIRVKLDTKNYRERRKETLENLAKNISYKVKRTRRPVALEPMNPYERRIIHSVLQGDKDIMTRSEGEEPYRHVVVFCAKKRNNK